MVPSVNVPRKSVSTPVAADLPHSHIHTLTHSHSLSHTHTPEEEREHARRRGPAMGDKRTVTRSVTTTVTRTVRERRDGGAGA